MSDLVMSDVPFKDMETDDKESNLELHAGANHPLDPLPPVDNNPYDAEGEPQNGVLQMAAITSVWSRKSLITVYIFMFMLYLVNAFRLSITGNLGAYVVSGFEAHSLIPVIGVVSSCMSAASYMCVAKVLNLFDRSYGFAAMVAMSVVGMILSATCTNIAMYCAAEVLTSIGFTSLILSIDVITADTSSLRDRGLAYAYTSSPYIITAFAGSKAAEGFYDTNWRWGYGAFTIILPFVAAPLFGILQFNKKKAEKKGLLKHVASGRTFQESVWHYVIEFDLLGVILLAGGLALFLLPFSLAASTADEWKSPKIICMLVFGLVMLIGFAVVERYVAPKPFIPYRLLTDRTVLGACMVDFTYQIAYYCWYSYFTSFLQVVYSLSIAEAGYVGSTFDVVSGFWLLVVGYLIRRTGYFRWLLWTAVPLYLLGVGLMIHFRQPDQPVGFVIMCQIFIAFAGGTMIICQQVAVLSVASHNDAAAMLALLGVFGYVGGAIGNSISGAIWTHVLPNELQRLLPADTVADWEAIYEDLDLQLSYEKGTATRDAIIAAYSAAQSKMLIAGTAIMGLALIWVAIIRNIKVSEVEQVKGLLF